MTAALDLLGVQYDFVHSAIRPTLEKFVGGCRPGVRYIVRVTGHLVALMDGVIVDNHAPYGCPVGEHSYRRKRVKSYYIIADRSAN